MKKRIAGALQTPRTALHVNAAVRLARGFLAESRQIIEMKIDVIGDHQVEIAVAVVVGKGRAGGEAAIAHPRLLGHVSKSAVAIVAIKHVPAQAGDVNIWPAIIVVVAHRAAHGKTGIAHAGLIGHIGERAIVIVVIKRAAGFFALQGHGHRGRVCEINVQPAVAVVVNEQNPAAHALHNEFFLRRDFVRKMNAGGGGDIDKLRRRSRAGIPCFAVRGCLLARYRSRKK